MVKHSAVVDLGDSGPPAVVVILREPARWWRRIFLRDTTRWSACELRPMTQPTVVEPYYASYQLVGEASFALAA